MKNIPITIFQMIKKHDCSNNLSPDQTSSRAGQGTAPLHTHSTWSKGTEATGVTI